MKTNIGLFGNKEIKIKKIKDNQIIESMKKNISFTTDKMVYIANQDNTQGLITKVEKDKVFTIINNLWVEI
jgi:hypothetical protein